MENTLKGKGNRLDNRISLFFCFYALFTIVIYTLPMLKITLPYMAVALVLLAGMFFFMYMSSKWMYYVIILCIASIIIAAINLLTGSRPLIDGLNELVRNIRFFIPFLWGSFAVKYCTEKQKKFVLIVFGIMCGYILIKTFDALQTVPDVCRELAKSTSRESAVRTGYRMQNVGGFEYSYMMGIVTLGFVWNAVTNKSKLIKILSIAATIVCYYFIIQTMYTLLLILVFVGTLGIFFFNTKKLYVRIIILLGVMFSVIFLEPGLKFLADLFSFNYGLEEKFTSMYLALRYDDVDMVGSRPEYLMAGIVNWIEHPIFGGVHKNDSNCHSFIIATLESSGIVGLAVWSGFFGFNWKQIRSLLPHTTLFDVTMLYVLLLSIFNPIGYVFEIVFVAYFIIPIWTYVFKSPENTNSLK